MELTEAEAGLIKLLREQVPADERKTLWLLIEGSPSDWRVQHAFAEPHPANDEFVEMTANKVGTGPTFDAAWAARTNEPYEAPDDQLVQAFDSLHLPMKRQ